MKEKIKKILESLSKEEKKEIYEELEYKFSSRYGKVQINHEGIQYKGWMFKDEDSINLYPKLGIISKAEYRMREEPFRFPMLSLTIFFYDGGGIGWDFYNAKDIKELFDAFQINKLSQFKGKIIYALFEKPENSTLGRSAKGVVVNKNMVV